MREIGAQVKKITCPYCDIDLIKGEEGDDVVKCAKCGVITCELCFATHLRETHPEYILYGKLDEEGRFMVRSYQLCDE